MLSRSGQPVLGFPGLAAGWRRPRMGPDQLHGGIDEISIIPRRGAVRQDCDIFKPRADSVPPFESAPIHRPARNVISVMNLLQRNACRCHDFLHPGSMLDGETGILIEWLDQDAAATSRQSRPDKGLCISNTQQSSLNGYASRKQMAAKLVNPSLALICRDKIGPLFPCRDDSEPFSRLTHDGGGGREGDRHTGAESPDCAENAGAGSTVESLAAGFVECVDMHGLSAGIDGRPCRHRDCIGSARRRRVNPVSVQSRLQENSGRLSTFAVHGIRTLSEPGRGDGECAMLRISATTPSASAPRSLSCQ